jgi:hypothetical protein
MSHDTATPSYEDLVQRTGQNDFRRGRLLSIALVIVGVGAFAWLLTSGQSREAWTAYLVNLVFFLGIAQAGIVWAAVARTTRGTKWASTLVRYAEAMSAFLPIGYLLVIVFLFAGGMSLYSWVKEPIAQKAAWLNFNFFVGREVILMGALLLMSRRLLGLSLAPDLWRLKDKVPAALRGQYVKEAGKTAPDLVATQKQLLNLSPFLVLVYCLVYSFWAFDIMMALDPHWVSTLFGAFIFMSTLYTGLAVLSLATIWTRKPLGLESVIATEQYHTIGKLLFSFALFWVYSYWSQFLPIWYGNLTEETPFVVLRLSGPFAKWAWTVFFLAFFIPFFGLMNWTTKRKPELHQWFALIALLGIWLERNLIIQPAVHPKFFLVSPATVGIMLGFLGAFTLTFLNFARKYPMLSSLGIPSGAPAEWSGGH